MAEPSKAPAEAPGPDGGQANAPPSASGRSRRSFLELAVPVLGVALIAEMIWLVTGFLRPRNRARGESGGIVVAGPVDGFTPGSMTAFPRGRFYLARLADGGFLALHRRCTHLGCTVPWVGEVQRFVCPCHASSFDVRGDVLSPPAPRALDLFPVRIENDMVKVDTRKPRRRSAFHPSQVTRV